MESPDPANTPPDATVSLHGSDHNKTAARKARETRLPEIEGYTLIRELGRGGMGVVYEARHLKLNRTVALKMVLAGEHAGERMMARFLKEAEIAAGLQHTNIIQIYELGEAMDLPFIAMELAGGLTMADRIQATGNDYRAIAAFFEKLARATHWAHQRAVIHRDLKPANILIGPDGEPKIADFGLAKRLNDDSALLTRSGEHMGTPAYMAPEQAFPELGAIGPAVDIYSLGVILYEALTGTVPFKGTSQAEVLTKLREQEPTSPLRLRTGMPRELATICLKCLRKVPAERYASAGDFADDLRRFQNYKPILARPQSPMQQSCRWARRHPVKIVLFGIFFAAAGAGATWWLQQEVNRQQYEERFVTEYTETFPAFLKEHGHFRGLGKRLTAEQRARRFYSWQITRAGREGKYIRMTLVDSAGRPAWHWASPDLLAPGMLTGVPRHRLPCTFELRYNAEGHVSEERLTDAAGQLVTRLRYTYPEGYDPDKPQTGLIQADFVDESARPLETASGLSSVQLLRDNRGREQRLLYADAKGNPKKDADGAGGIEVQYDDSGFAKQITVLNDQGQPSPNTKGKALTRFTRDPDGNLLTSSFHNASGDPVVVDGCHLMRNENDQWGNTIAVHCFGLDGKPAPNLSAGSPGPTDYVWEPDHRGLPLTLTSSGYDPAKTSGYTRLVLHYDWQPDGSVTTLLECLNDAGNQVRSGGGWLTIQEQFDTLGRKQSSTGHGYEPAKTGYVRQLESTVWNPQGNKMSDRVLFQDAQGNPASERFSGAAERMREFGPGERLERETRSGFQKEPYDRIVIETVWDDTEKPGTGRFPCLVDSAAAVSADDARQSTPLQSSNARSGIRALLTKSAAKRLKSTGRYLDKDGHPVPCSSGNTTWEREYFPDGQTARTETHTGFSPADFPYARIVISTTLNDANKTTATVWEYFDAAGKPVRNKERYLSYTEVRDANDKIVSVTKAGYDEAKSGFAKEASDYSGWEGSIYRRRRWTYYNSAGAPARYPDGYSEYIEDYDAQGVQTRIVTSGYDPAIVPFFRQVSLRQPGSSNDTYQLLVHWEDATGQPARGRRGERTSIEEYSSDEGRLLSVQSSGFDEAERGFAQSSVRFAPDGLPAAIAFTNSQGRPVPDIRPRISAIEPGSTAATLKLQPGDIILSYAGQPAGCSYEFIAKMNLTGGSLEIQRAGRPILIPAVPPGKLGVYLSDHGVKP